MPVDPPPGSAWFYASELVDKRSCAACRAVDGREYATWAEALEDYPDGTYRECEHGSDGCRGTVVAVSDQESPPSR